MKLSAVGLTNNGLDMSDVKKICIVEDNDLNMKLFRDLLENNGYRVSFTQDGHEAFDLINANQPDLILMDIQLHGISGFDIIRRIKSDDKVKSIPIIAVTAFAMKGDRDRILETGCDAYVPKPISITPFLETVKELLN